MGLYKADADAGFVHAEAGDLAYKLKYGDGILWVGDDRLELIMAHASAPKSMWYTPLGRRVRKGEILGRRYEVHRHNEDGSVTQIGHWLLEEFDRILMDIAPLRMDSPGHVDALDQIDAHNDKLDKDRSDAIVDAMGEMMEHKIKLVHDITEGRNVFRGMPGTRDEKPAADPVAAE